MNIHEPITLGYTKSLEIDGQLLCHMESIEALNVNFFHISGRLALLFETKCDIYWASIYSLCEFSKNAFFNLIHKILDKLTLFDAFSVNQSRQRLFHPQHLK